MTAFPTALIVLAIFTVIFMLALVVVTVRDNRRRRGTVTITIAPDTTAFVAAIKRAQRDTEKAARQIGDWR